MTYKEGEKKTCIFLGIFALVLSVLFLGICSKSSPLYPLNDWVDVNCFFTMGRSMLHGKVLYRDLYEQKGPVLYFVYALAALISEHTFWGVFALEVITFALFLYFSGRLAMVYVKGRLGAPAVMLATAALVPVSTAFAHGCGAEEMHLFFLTFALWQMLAAARKKEEVPAFAAALIGAGFASALFSKYTFCGFYAGIVLAVPVVYFTSGIKPGRFFRSVGFFLAGFAGVTAVVLLYFAANGALKDLWEVYFYNNITLYPMEAEGSRLTVIWQCLQGTWYSNLSSYSRLLAAAGIWLVIRALKHWRELIVCALSFAGLAVTTYYGGRGYAYYGLIFAAFVPLGAAAILNALEWICIKAAQAVRMIRSRKAERTGEEDEEDEDEEERSELLWAEEEIDPLTAGQMFWAEEKPEDETSGLIAPAAEAKAKVPASEEVSALANEADDTGLLPQIASEEVPEGLFEESGTAGEAPGEAGTESGTDAAQEADSWSFLSQHELLAEILAADSSPEEDDLPAEVWEKRADDERLKDPRPARLAFLKARALRRLSLVLGIVEALLLLSLTMLLLSYDYGHSGNVYLMKYRAEDTPPYIFADEIAKTPDAKILNYGFLDGGFYFAADSIPECRFFCTLNIEGTDMWDVQRAYIESGEPDYIITRYYTLNQYSPRTTEYHLIKTATLTFEGWDFTYYLYGK